MRDVYHWFNTIQYNTIVVYWTYRGWQEPQLELQDIIHSFIHFNSAPSSPLLLRDAPDYSTDTVSEFTPQSAQATAGKGLAQSPYVAARAGVEPTTLRLKFIVSTKAPPRPTIY